MIAGCYGEAAFGFLCERVWCPPTIWGCRLQDFAVCSKALATSSGEEVSSGAGIKGRDRKSCCARWK